jgi:uncharacterized lipoprotein
MTSKSSLWRGALGLVLIAAVVASSGCSWFRGRSGYENASESRPLEVPPDLDRPTTDPAMQIPAVSETAARGPATGNSFAVADEAENVWKRLGEALQQIDGVTIDSRAQLLSVYNVRYEGEAFLVKVAEEDDKRSLVSAVSADGRPLVTGAAGRLLTLLKERLG